MDCSTYRLAHLRNYQEKFRFCPLNQNHIDDLAVVREDSPNDATYVAINLPYLTDE